MTRADGIASVNIDSARWLQASREPDGRVRLEYHYPRREASVGYIDKPAVAIGKTLRETVNRTLRAAELVPTPDADELIRRLALSQIDLFGNEIPVEELELATAAPVLAMLRDRERDAGRALDPDEAGALIHARRGKHDEGQRCRWCGEDGAEAIARLRDKTEAPLEPPAGQERDGDHLGASSTGRHPAGGSSGSATGPPQAGEGDGSGLGPNEAVEPPPIARARSTDPATSHAAARSVTAETVTATKAAILELYRTHGPMTDEELLRRYLELEERFTDPPKSTPSGLRTRRAELVDASRVINTGRTAQVATGRRAIVWALAADDGTVYDPEPDL